MKQYQISNAYETLKRIGGFQLPTKTAYALWTLAKKLEPTQLFVDEQRRKLIDEHHATVRNNGLVLFSSKEDENGFREAITELANTDIEIELDPVHVPIDAFEDQKLSIVDIAKLEGFVVFDEAMPRQEE